MSILESAFAQGFIRLADDGARMGWHERNAGNLSYRIKPAELKEIEGSLGRAGEWKPIRRALPVLAGDHVLVTGTGKYFRNAALDPEDGMAIAELDGKGENYRIRWGMPRGGGPTSEFPSHLVCHAAKKRQNADGSRVVYHAHPANINAMTFVLPLDSKVFTRELWQIVSECAIVFPKGIGVMGWMVPGSPEMADASAREIERYDAVVWPHHGLLAIGETFDEAFGLMHTIEKAAEIWVKIKSTGMPVRQAITDENLADLDKAFHLGLPGRFLSGE